MNENIDSSISDTKDSVIIKLIDLSEKQNELIFATRERLFKLEKIQKRDILFLLGMNFLICTACILIAVEFGGLTW